MSTSKPSPVATTAGQQQQQYPQQSSQQQSLGQQQTQQQPRTMLGGSQGRGQQQQGAPTQLQHQTGVSNAGLQAKMPGTTLVEGEQKQTVNVQSQLASSNVAGDVTSHSNIGQVIADLGKAHSGSNGWLESETEKVSAWGRQEIARILEETKRSEAAIIANAKERQAALDSSHAADLKRMVADMDARKATQLKDLEDGLQRQIQGVLTASKNDINRIESEVNNKQMDLLKRSQLKSAKEIDQLTNLVVETKLVPSQTRTVIETNTETGNVMAVATGGQISTGSAQADTHSSQRIAAIPNAGELRQGGQTIDGDIMHNESGRKVGEGTIAQSLTRVTQQGQQGQGLSQGGQDVNVRAAPMRNDLGGQQLGGQQQQYTSGQSGSSGTVLDKDVHSGATQREGQQLPIDHGREAGSTAGVAATHNPNDPRLQEKLKKEEGYSHKDSTGVLPKTSMIAGNTTAHRQQHETLGDKAATHSATEDKTRSDGYFDKHAEEPHKHGMMCKLKHALGMGTEPTSTEATSNTAATAGTGSTAKRI